ncbi:MAG: hypothetical protein QOJ81_1669 [Chloroflexota bacterium]|nr:hypothetical protein [Chloroflexota bacterium]
MSGIVLGVLAATAGLVFGTLGMAAAIVAVALVALVPRLPVFLAGGLVGVGATWLVLFSRQAAVCAQPDQPCGATPLDMAPWLAFSAAVFLVGVAIGVRAGRAAGRRG